MFSGISNQFSSLVGAVKGGQTDENAAAAGQDAAPVDTAAAEQHSPAATTVAAGEQPAEGDEHAKRSPSLVDSFMHDATGWLGSAKGWLGSASIPSMPAMPSMPSMPAMPAMPSIPSIPGLRKSGAGDAAEGAADGAENIDATAAAGVVSADDDDKSRYISATEGADSHPASGVGTPTGEEGQIGQGKADDVKITTKVTQQAKHFGSFLSSAINKAGAKIKETVKENPILESFNKEQEAFIKGQAGGANNGAAPWIGLANEAKIKEEILGLAQDRRNFVRAPPAGVDFDFNYETAYPTAIAIMAEDKALETMRFELVPKIITEENFWRNYFYRVSLIIQAAELGTLGADGVGQASSGEDAKNNQKRDVHEPVERTETVSTAKPSVESNTVAANNAKENVENNTKTNAKNSSNRNNNSESEFVSDSFPTNANANDLAEIKDSMRKLGIDSMTHDVQQQNDAEEQWEKDLEAELKDYEVVSDKQKRNQGGNKNAAEDDDELPTISNLRTRSTNDWEEYADLIEDTDDLKTLKSIGRAMLGYKRDEHFFTLF